MISGSPAVARTVCTGKHILANISQTPRPNHLKIFLGVLLDVLQLPTRLFANQATHRDFRPETLMSTLNLNSINREIAHNSQTSRPNRLKIGGEVHHNAWHPLRYFHRNQITLRDSRPKVAKTDFRTFSCQF